MKPCNSCKKSDEKFKPIATLNELESTEESFSCYIKCSKCYFAFHKKCLIDKNIEFKKPEKLVCETCLLVRKHIEKAYFLND